MKQPLARAGLVVVGDEILGGRRQDRHMQQMLRVSGELQIDISWVYYLPDDLAQLVRHFKAIRDTGETCFSFGGIGATPDDVTRQAMAASHDLPLVAHPEALRLIEHQFGKAAYPNRVRMADLPQGAGLVPNPYNNIPGFFLGEIYCLPGFPEMAWPMLEWVVETYYDTGANPTFLLHSFMVVGAKESELIEPLESVQAAFPGLKVSSLPRFPADGTWRVELGVRGEREQVEPAVALLTEKVRAAGFGIESGTT